jgi:hypothetical protein
MNGFFPQKIKVFPQVLFQEIGNEAVLLDLKSERYFGLNEVSTRAWQLIKKHGDMHAVCQAMLDEYAVQEAPLYQDLSELVARLVSAGLIALEPCDTSDGAD